MLHGSSLERSSARWWLLALVTCCAFALCWRPSPAWGSEQPQSVESESDWRLRLLDTLRTADEQLIISEAKWTALGNQNDELREASRRARSEIDALKNELAEQKKSLAESRASLTESEASLSRALMQIDELTKLYDLVSASFSEYWRRTEATVRAREAEVLAWKLVALGAGLVAVGVGAAWIVVSLRGAE